MNVVSFFAGCGGLDLGFEQAGFHVVWANEIDSTVQDTYVRNHPNTKFVLGDICKISPVDVPDCDGFIGGPPCQSWSVAGKQRGLEDKRGQLFLTYIEMIKAKAPKFFLIENVKGLLDKKFNDVFEDFIFRLDEAGYDVQWQLLDAVNYKIPQNRERVFIIGFRKDLNIQYEFPEPTCSEPIPLIKAIGDISERPREFRNEKIISVNTERFNHDVFVGSFGPYYKRGNRRRTWESPSFTIHATGENAPLHPDSPKMVFFGHENWNFQQDKITEYRRLSVRECARIQTFPDHFVFDCPNIKALYKMIGNAVPPRLGYVLANSILAKLSSEVQLEHRVVNVPINITKTCILVGYYKNFRQHELILKNLLYYVRSDGRVGSVFKEDCSVMPKYLLLHHGNNAEIFELEVDDPALVYDSYLRTLGFEPTGQKYLCFRLKSDRKIKPSELGGSNDQLNYEKYNFSPYFTTIDNITK